MNENPLEEVSSRPYNLGKKSFCQGGIMGNEERNVRDEDSKVLCDQWFTLSKNHIAFYFISPHR